MRCIVCGNESFEMFHQGTRDNSEIDVMRCEKCRGLQLSSFSQIKEGFYEDGNMHENQYSVLGDTYLEQDWNSWMNETKEDDYRRADVIRAKIEGGGLKGNNVLDFGCGNGGFLRRLKEQKMANVVGVELDQDARKHLLNEGINVYESIDMIDPSVKFDIITMFHVIEHLEEPDKIMRMLREKLVDNGLLVVETPNADDALISQFHSEKFMDFTFWSAHLFLYTSDSLRMLMNNCGFSVVKNSQVQRYPLANHLYWLSEGLPGGHVKWKELSDDLLNKSYEDMLKKIHKCDTLFGVFRR